MFKRLTFTLLLAFGAQSAHLYSQEKPTIEIRSRSVIDALPASTTFVVQFRNCTDLTQKFKDSPLYTLKDVPSIKESIDMLKSSLEEGLAEARQDLGFDPLDFLEQIEGELILALGGLDKILQSVMAEMSGQPSQVTAADVPFLVAFNAGKSTTKINEYIEKVFSYIEKEGGRREQEDFQGGTIWTFSNKKEPIADPPPGLPQQKNDDLEKVYFARKDSNFFFSVNRDFLQETMSGLGENPPAVLSRNADFIVSHREVEKDSDVMVFLNIQSLTSGVTKVMQANPMFGMIWTLLQTELIGGNLKNVAMSVNLEKDEIYSLSFVNTGGAREGLLALMDGPTFSSRKPVSGLPPDTEEFSAVTVNIPKLYDLLLKIGGMAMMFTGGQPGMDLEQIIEQQIQMKPRDVVEAFGSKIYSFSQTPKKSDPNPTLPPPTPTDLALGNTTFAIELKREEPIKNFLGKIPGILGGLMGAALPGPGLKTEKYLERDIYRLEEESGLVLAFVDKTLVVGNIDSIKGVIRRTATPGSSLTESPEFQAVAKEMPEQVSSFNYWTMSGTPTQKRVESILAEMIPGFDETVPVPDFEKIFAIFDSAASYSQWKSQGLYGRSWTKLKPHKKLKTTGK